jgi:hypothetical protein
MQLMGSVVLPVILFRKTGILCHKKSVPAMRTAHCSKKANMVKPGN